MAALPARLATAGTKGSQSRLGLCASIWLVGLVLALGLGAPPASAAPDCQFVLGFKVIHDQIPSIVGDYRVNEHFNPTNGDTLQETARGLLVWRKADNFTAFTDGYRTWVNGPYGLQARLNAERFAWERDRTSPPVATSTPKPATTGTEVTCASLPASKVKGTDVDVVDWSVKQAGSSGWMVVGQVRNNCTQTRHVGLNATLLDGTQPVAATESGYWRLGPGESSDFSLAAGPVPRASVDAHFRWESIDPVARNTASCVTVDGQRLKTDPWLVDTVSELNSLEAGAPLVSSAAQNGILLRRASLADNVFGQYSRRSHSITLNSQLDTYGDWERAAVLAHELQHARDDAAGLLLPQADVCFKNEEDGFRRGAEIWNAFWKGRLPAAQNPVQEQLNSVVQSLQRDPTEFLSRLRRTYQSECGRD